MKMFKNNGGGGGENTKRLYENMRILGRPLKRWHKNVPDRKIMRRRKRR
jgi:hypothetical protein